MQSNYQSNEAFKAYFTDDNKQRIFHSGEVEVLSVAKCKPNDLGDEGITLTASDYSDEDSDM